MQPIKQELHGGDLDIMVLAMGIFSIVVHPDFTMKDLEESISNLLKMDKKKKLEFLQASRRLTQSFDMARKTIEQVDADMEKSKPDTIIQ